MARVTTWKWLLPGCRPLSCSFAFGVGFALLLPVLFGLDGVLYSMPVSDALTFVISVIAIVSTYRALTVQEGGPHV